MILKKYNELPENMQNQQIKQYYEILQNRKISLCIKRGFDIIFSLLLLVMLSPVFLILAIWIKWDSKGPIFFRQERVTQYGKLFRIFKFRTMYEDAEKQGSLVTTKADIRITKVGKWIRKIRLDELPQLFNVFVGDMTFVGTRPEIKKYVDNYTDEMVATLFLPAGITSMASIKYKDEDEILSKKTEEGENIDQIYQTKILPEKMKYNLKYIQEFSIWEDLKICVKTITEIF